MKTLREQIAGRCVNHRSFPNETCKAGVRYDSLRILDNCCSAAPTVACPSRQLRTAAQVDAELAQVQATLAEMDERIAGYKCIECGAKVERAKQVGVCIYSEPCGHRIGRGDANTYNRELAKKAS